jgi:outer membrane protein assembly factor BamA
VSVYNSCNNLTVAKDDTNGFNIKGQSSSVGVGLTVPEKITADCREELVFDLQRQVSQNKVLGMTFVDDTEKRFSVGKTFLKMWPGRAVYLKPVFTYCQYDGLGGEKAVRKFSLDAFWQKALKMGQQLNLRMSGQKAGNDYLPSADQLYLGGLYSVRGYDESIIGGDSGLNLKLDYSFPLPGINGSQLFTFYDWGRVYGKSLVSTRMIDSAGLGIKHSFTNDSQIVLTLGFPFVKKIGDEKIASHKVDLAVNFIF